MKTMIRVLLASILAMAGCAPSAARAQAQRNILVIYLDDWDNHVSKAYMPRLNALVGQQGVVFNNAFVTTPKCGPSRASFMTGQLAHNHGVWGPDIGSSWGAFRQILSNTLPVWMQQAGYATGYFGKLMNNFNVQDGYVPPGLDSYAIYSGNHYYYFDYKLYEKGQTNQHGSAEADYITDVLAQKVRYFIKTAVNQKKPFFAVFAPIGPHAPAVAAPRDVGYYATAPFPHSLAFNEADVSDKPLPISEIPYLTPDDVSAITDEFHRRLDTMKAVDDDGAGIINMLSALGVLANTDVIVTSDNGMSLGSHRWPYKVLQYNETVRVPLYWRGPGIAPGQTRDQFVSNVDMTATILDRAGVTPGQQIDGRSYAGILSGSALTWRSGVYFEGYLDDNRLPETGYRYWGVQTPVRMFTEVRGPNYVQTESYDSALDPFQTTNTVLAIPTDQRQQWRALVEDLRSCAGATCNQY